MFTVSIMGMEFESGTELDFGSIRMTHTKYNGVNEYILKSSDINKLDLITNAADGSTALCVDTADLYILHMGEWVKFGEVSEENTENTAQTQSVNLSPLNINREELTESSGLNKSELPDSLTVEPITESLTGDKNLNQNEELWGSNNLTVEPINSEELR